MVADPYLGAEASDRPYLRLLPPPKPLYNDERLGFLRQMIRHSTSAENALGWSQSTGIDDVVREDEVKNILGRTKDGHVIYSNTYRLFAVPQERFEQWMRQHTQPIGTRTVVEKRRKRTITKSVPVFDPLLVEYAQHCGWSHQPSDLISSENLHLYRPNP